MNETDSQRAPVLATIYQQFCDDEDTAAFLAQTARRYSVGTLERLAQAGNVRLRRAALLAIGFLANYDSAEVVGRALRDRDKTVRLIADNALRGLWLRYGTESQRRQLVEIMRANGSGRYEEANRLATLLLREAPRFAEAWNQRAIARYQLGRYKQSIADCRRTLEINRYHFGAASGMGQCYLELGETLAGLECFRTALRIHPSHDGVRNRVRQLQEKLELE